MQPGLDRSPDRLITILPDRILPTNVPAADAEIESGIGSKRTNTWN